MDTVHKSEPTVPADVDVVLGSLTWPSSDVGPKSSWKYLVRNKLVYAYSKATGCLNTNPSAPNNTGKCIEWSFIDASTGEHIETNWQPIADSGADQRS